MSKKTQAPEDDKLNPPTLPPVELETVELPKAQWDAVMRRLDTLEESNKILEGLAGKNAIVSYKERTADHTVKTARLKVFDGKLVVGWHKGTQEVHEVSKGVWTETMTIVLEFEDQTEKEIQYVNFIRSQDFKEFIIKGVRVIGHDQHGTPKCEYQLEDENGKVVTVNESFLNPC